MISLEEVRQSVVAAFKDVHDTHYSSTLVNYPNFTVVDLEHQTDPFVNVELDFTNTEQAALGEKEIYVHGILYVTFYFRDGSGMSGAYSYTDMLNQYLGMSVFNSIGYQAAKVINIQTFPGWQGSMNQIPFDIVTEANCS